MKKISVVTPCFNEEQNIEQLYNTVKSIFSTELKDYDYEHIFIDNCSRDRTVEIISKIASVDKKVKIIVNSRNFGHIRSPYYGLLQTSGDAAMPLACDFQDPPYMIPKFVRKWEEGYKIVVGVKTKNKDISLMLLMRSMYYKLIKNISEVELIENYPGFGLYDKRIIEILRGMKEPYPYLRGLICEIGFDIAKIEYSLPKRERGITKTNLYMLYDMAMVGITSNSKIPLRIATMLGFILSGISLFIAFIYFVLKLVYWDKFDLGLAPLIIGLFFFSSVQLFFIGIIGEYIAIIFTKITNRPLVIEKERINFDNNES